MTDSTFEKRCHFWTPPVTCYIIPSTYVDSTCTTVLKYTLRLTYKGFPKIAQPSKTLIFGQIFSFPTLTKTLIWFCFSPETLISQYLWIYRDLRFHLSTSTFLNLQISINRNPHFDSTSKFMQINISLCYTHAMTNATIRLYNISPWNKWMFRPFRTHNEKTFLVLAWARESGTSCIKSSTALMWSFR